MKINITGILFIVFLVLKLTGVIAWSWLWVTAPLWLGFVVIGIAFTVATAVASLHNRRLR